MQAGAWWVIAALLAYIAQLVSIVWMEHRRQSHLVAWVFIAMVCPFIGYVAYWLVGRRLRRIPVERAGLNSRRLSIKGESSGTASGNVDQADRVDAFVTGHLPYPATHRNRVKVLTDGEETFDAILEAISHAKHHVHLDYYTVRSDGIGRRFLELLTAKAKAGVKVRLLYDGIGSLHLDKIFLEELDRCGAEHACFSPPGESLLRRRLNYRNHRKIVVVDGRLGFLGGINIGDEYLGLDKRLGFWRDSHLKLEGECVHQLQAIFAENWQRATNICLALGRDAGRRSIYTPEPRRDGHDRVVLVPGKPGIHDQLVSETLFLAMSEARQSIYASSPYFIPDPMIAGSLRIAARSGLDVRLIIPGISDSKLVLLATLSYMQDMLEAGVKVYRYEKGFIHAKVMIIDGRAASVGSANLDMRSLYSNYEILALIEGKEPVGRLMKDFMEDIANSKPLDPARFANRPAKAKAAETLMHLLSPLL